MPNRENKESQKIVIDRKRFILLILAIIILGALLYRKWYAVGNAVTLVAIGIYLAADLRKTLTRIICIRRLSRAGRWRLLMWFALLFVAVSLWRGGTISYLLLLILLGLDYLITDDSQKQR